MADQNKRSSHSSTANFGILLIIIGVVMLCLQFLHIDLGWLPGRWAELQWPLRIIIPGAVMFVVGLLLPGGIGDGLSGFGLVAAAVGCLLWYQAVTGTWSSWAYAWALVFPAAGGLAGILHGIIHADWHHVRESFGELVFGCVAFVVLGFVFERWLGFEGFGFSKIAAWIPGVILLGIGAVVLLAGTPGERSVCTRHGSATQPVEPGKGPNPVEVSPAKTSETVPPAEPSATQDGHEPD